MGTFSTRVKLTERTVTAARPAAAKSKQGAPCARLYLDTEQRGFGLSVSAASVKSFLVMRRVHGKQERHVFGHFGELTVAEARARAAKLLPQMTDGVSLNEQRRRARAEAKRVEVRGITLAGALDLYEGTLKAKGRSARTIEDYRYLLEKYLAAWLDRPLAELSRAEVRKRHTAIAREIAGGRYTARRLRGAGFGEVTANHTMRAFRAVYNRALREHPELPVNPTINVDWTKEHPRDGPEHRIPDAGLRSWYESVQAQTNTVRRDCLLFTLFSGLRRANAAEPRWEHVDWERAVLHVPKPKSQKPFDLPLSGFLLDLLRRRQEENKKLAPDSPWVFPAAHGEGHIVETRAQGGAERAANRAGKAGAKLHYTSHDLRRTFISVAADLLDIPREARMLLVNHATSPDVHSRYIIQDPELKVLRAHMQAITDKLLAHCVPPEKTTVVQIRKRAAKVAR